MAQGCEITLSGNCEADEKCTSCRIVDGIWQQRGGYRYSRQEDALDGKIYRQVSTFDVGGTVLLELNAGQVTDSLSTGMNRYIQDVKRVRGRTKPTT